MFTHNYYAIELIARAMQEDRQAEARKARRFASITKAARKAAKTK